MLFNPINCVNITQRLTKLQKSCKRISLNLVDLGLKLLSIYRFGRQIEIISLQEEKSVY